MTSLTNHSQSVISHTHYHLPHTDSVICTQYCHLHTTLSVSDILSYFIFILFVIAANVTMFNLFAHSLSRTVMLILIFNSTAYCHAHSLILYTLYFILYILFSIHFILCILPLCCIVQYLHCPWSGPDSHFTAGYTISV